MLPQRTQHRPIRLAEAAITAGLAAVSVLGLATPAAAIVNGTDDFNTPQANAVVQVSEGASDPCTGTLITPDVVVVDDA